MLFQRPSDVHDAQKHLIDVKISLWVGRVFIHKKVFQSPSDIHIVKTTYCVALFFIIHNVVSTHPYNVHNVQIIMLHRRQNN